MRRPSGSFAMGFDQYFMCERTTIVNARLLRQGYRDLIDRWDWHQFTTNTFQNDVHPEQANRLWCLWINKMNRSLYGHRWYKPEVATSEKGTGAAAAPVSFSIKERSVAGTSPAVLLSSYLLPQKFILQLLGWIAAIATQ